MLSILGLLSLNVLLLLRRCSSFIRLSRSDADEVNAVVLITYTLDPNSDRGIGTVLAKSVDSSLNHVDNVLHLSCYAFSLWLVLSPSCCTTSSTDCKVLLIGDAKKRLSKIASSHNDLVLALGRIKDRMEIYILVGLLLLNSSEGVVYILASLNCSQTCQSISYIYDRRMKSTLRLRVSVLDNTLSLLAILEKFLNLIIKRVTKSSVLLSS